MVLPIPVNHRHGREDAVSLASRLSAGNGYPSLRSFLASGKVTMRDLIRGEDEAIAKLAKWSGVPPEDLARFAIQVQEHPNFWQLGHAVFNKEMRRGSRFRYCPNCIVNDMQEGWEQPASRPYVRVHWLTKAVANCSDHKRPLVEVNFPDLHKNDFARYAGKNVSVIEAQAAEKFAPQSVASDIYAEDRIKGIYREPYLDRFEAYVALDLSGYLGRFMKRQAATWALVPRHLQTSSLREIGFHFARQGVDTIRNVVLTYIRARKPNGSEKFLFGQLGRWLRSNSARAEYAELVELFQDVAERNLPFGPGDLCFIQVRKRYLHSIKSASTQYGLVERRVIQLMRDANLIGDERVNPSRTYFDAEKAHHILEGASQTLTSKEVRDELGISEELMADLLRESLLSRVESRAETRVYSRIRKEDVAEFKRNIAAACHSSENAKAMVTIAEAARACRCPAYEIISLVLGGRLKKVSAPVHDNFKIPDIRVDVEETCELVEKDRSAEWQDKHPGYVSLDDARALLRVKSQTIMFLIKHGLIDCTKLWSPQAFREHEYVSVKSIEKFRSEYVPLGELSAQYETHAIVITKALETVGVKPMPEKAGPVTRFYRRPEVDALAISRAVARFR